MQPHAPMPDAVSAVDEVLRSRKTIRAFQDIPVSRAQVVEILRVAATAPSNSNSQPWRVHVLAGDRKRALSEALLRAYNGNDAPAFSPFPEPLPDLLRLRQEDFGTRYYSALGIDRSNMQARAHQTGKNLTFFGAPIGMIFTINATLKKYSWLDYGLFIQNIMIAARARGLDTCPQVTFARFQTVIAEVLSLVPDEIVVCGMSLGYGDRDAAVNHLDMPRAQPETFMALHGFDE